MGWFLLGGAGVKALSTFAALKVKVNERVGAGELAPILAVWATDVILGGNPGGDPGFQRR
ncbi:MAG: hypothetical protein JNN11_04145 [Candidatus Doudnabacteria bacterium]|nr:hypothetical protein [Candidatus Doudnabacteria bacterium]